MKFSKAERLILINQYTILEKLYPEDSTFSLNKEILLNGYTHEYDEIVNILTDDVPEDVCQEVWDILQMHRSLKFSFDQLENKGDLNASDVKFRGFDGNNETVYMAYTRFVIHDIGRFEELKDEHRDYNSHWPTLDKYRHMLSKWKSVSERHNNKLSLEQIKEIISK